MMTTRKTNVKKKERRTTLAELVFALERLRYDRGCWLVGMGGVRQQEGRRDGLTEVHAFWGLIPFYVETD